MTLGFCTQIEIVFGCKIRKLFEGADIVALVGIAVLQRYIRQFIKTPVVQLPKGRIELADPPVEVGGEADIFLKVSLKGSWRDIKIA